MRFHKNQTGSVVIILLVILVLAIVSFGGYYVWSKKYVATTPSKNKTTVTTTITSTPKYLTIKEWGVRFKLPSDLPDVTYEPNEPAGVTPETIVLSSKIISNTVHSAQQSCISAGGGNQEVYHYKIGGPGLLGSPSHSELTVSDLDTMIQTYGARINNDYYVPLPTLFCRENTAALKTDKVAQQGYAFEVELLKSINTMQAVN